MTEAEKVTAEIREMYTAIIKEIKEVKEAIKQLNK